MVNLELNIWDFFVAPCLCDDKTALEKKGQERQLCVRMAGRYIYG
jgi:hypothetical protein